MAARSHRPHHHPNRRRPEEIQRIDNLRRRSPNTNLGCFGSSSGREGIHDSSPAFTGSCANGVRGREAAESQVYSQALCADDPSRTARADRRQVCSGGLPCRRCRWSEVLPVHQYASTPSSTGVPVSAIPRLLRNTAPFLPASSFTMLLRSSLMPLRISKPIPVRNSPTGATPPKPAVLHALRRRFPGSVSGASLSDPYTPRRSGKAERSRRKDNEGFYASRKFCSFDAFAAQLALRQRYYNNFPLRPLNRLSPKRLLSRLSSLEPYLCLTYNFSALPPEHRLDGVQARSTRSRTDGHEQNGARRCAEPEEQGDAPQSVTAAFCAAAECDKNPVRAYGILCGRADKKGDGAHPLFGVRAVFWRKRGEKR